MKKKILIRLSLSLIVLVSLLSCGTPKTSYKYDKVYPPISFAQLIDGYWGEWKEFSDMFGHKENRYRVQTQYNSQTLEILIYYKQNHPSDFKAKIIIDKQTGVQKDKTWTSYQGTITARKIPIRLDMSEGSDSSAKLRDIISGADYDNKTIKCTINCNEDMQKAIQNNGLFGVINLFYGDGKGDAINFWFFDNP